MSQSATLPSSDKETNAEVAEGKKAVPTMVPPHVVLEIVDTNKKAMSRFVNERMSAWRTLSPQRKRFLALFGSSVVLSVTMACIATVIARRITRKRTIKAAL